MTFSAQDTFFFFADWTFEDQEKEKKTPMEFSHMLLNLTSLLMPDQPQI